jgi:fatty-acyl-CoA synthase
MVMDGYVGMPEETARVLDREGWLHTGDLCSMGEDGVIRFHGRRRDLIIRGGQNVYPDEVEHVLLRHPGVGQVAVVGVPDDRWGEQVAAVVVPTSQGAGVDAEELEAYARRFLASYKVPFHWKTVSDLPLTYSGKVKKFEVRQSLIASLEE